MLADDPLSILRIRLVGLLAFALGIFHLANVSGLLVLSTMIVRALHLTIMMVLVFMKPWELGASPSLSEYGVRKYLDTFFGLSQYCPGWGISAPLSRRRKRDLGVQVSLPLLA